MATATKFRTRECPPFHEKADKGRCFICGQKLKPGSSRGVRVVGGGGEILHPEDCAEYDVAGDPAADLYYWEVGPDCAKRHGLEGWLLE